MTDRTNEKDLLYFTTLTEAFPNKITELFDTNIGKDTQKNIKEMTCIINKAIENKDAVLLLQLETISLEADKKIVRNKDRLESLDLSLGECKAIFGRTTTPKGAYAYLTRDGKKSMPEKMPTKDVPQNVLATAQRFHNEMANAYPSFAMQNLYDRRKEAMRFVGRAYRENLKAGMELEKKDKGLER